jgi:DNA-binding NarL/FixJ family response regulator
MHIDEIVAVSSGIDKPSGDHSCSASPDIPPVGEALQTACVAVVDSRSLLRECIVRYIAASGDFVALGYDCVDEICHLEGSHGRAIVVLCSIAETRKAALGELARLRNRNSSCPVVVLTGVNDHDLTADFLRHGARGVIPLAFPADSVVEALRFVHAGGTFVPSESLPPKPGIIAGHPLPGSCALTKREEQIVTLLRSGKQNKQIAYDLGLSIGTVKVHLHNIMNKLGARNRIQVLACRGLIAGSKQTAIGHLPPVSTGTGAIAGPVRSATA